MRHLFLLVLHPRGSWSRYRLFCPGLVKNTLRPHCEVWQVLYMVICNKPAELCEDELLWTLTARPVRPVLVVLDSCLSRLRANASSPCATHQVVMMTKGLILNQLVCSALTDWTRSTTRPHSFCSSMRETQLRPATHTLHRRQFRLSSVCVSVPGALSPSSSPSSASSVLNSWTKMLK